MQKKIIRSTDIEVAKRGVLMLLNNAAPSEATRWMTHSHLISSLPRPVIILQGKPHHNDFCVTREAVEAALKALQAGAHPFITLNMSSHGRCYCITEKGKKKAAKIAMPEEIAPQEQHMATQAMNGAARHQR